MSDTQKTSAPATGLGKISRAVSWSAFELIFKQGFKTLVLITLGRLLEPEHFGVMASVAFFAAIGNLIVEGGFSKALIQKKDTSATDESTVFFFVLALGATLACFYSVSAYSIAKFYEQPILEVVLWWFSINILLNSAGAIPSALLMKSLNFRTLAKISTLATVLSGLIAIAMAYYGWGVWSLVGQILSYSLCYTTLVWYCSGWRPQFIFDWTSLKSFLKFGGNLMLTGLVSLGSYHMYAMLFGKFYPANEVGYYSQGRRIQDLPSSLLTSAIGRVAFPVFSANLGDKKKLAEHFDRALSILLFANTPIMCGLALVADPLVSLVLGAKWAPAVPFIQLLSLVGAVWPLLTLNINLLVALGFPHLLVRLQGVIVVIRLTIFIITSPYGIKAVTAGQVVLSYIAFFVNSYYTNRNIDYPVTRQITKGIKSALSAIPFALAVIGVCSQNTTDLLAVILSVLVSIPIYLMTCHILKIEGYQELYSMIKRRKKKAPSE